MPGWPVKSPLTELSSKQGPRVNSRLLPPTTPNASLPLTPRSPNSLLKHVRCTDVIVMLRNLLAGEATC